MTDTTPDDSVFILITQCLQNAFFLSDESRLSLPPDIVMRMLVGDQKANTPEGEEGQHIDWTKAYRVGSNNRRVIPSLLILKGPLYQFFEAVTGESERNHPLHIIHIRDWHAPSNQYDEERKLYGIHCEANSWEAAHLDGFGLFLEPWGAQVQKARSPDGWRCRREGNTFVDVSDSPSNKDIYFYDVRSDSVYDFNSPDSDDLKTELKQVLSASNTTPLGESYKPHDSLLQLILDHLIFRDSIRKVYILVIGVYTDIKIKTLLVALRSRYDINGLFVSDVLTDAPSLERHLEGLDFAHKVANAQIVHSLNEIVSVVNPGAAHIIDDGLTETTVNFGAYARHFLDRAKLLAFQDQRLLSYVELAGTRSEVVYRQIFQANAFLILVGKLLLGLTVLLIILRVASSLFDWGEVPTDVILISTGLTVAQLITSFFLIPSIGMRKNLFSLVRLRNYLETYSNVTALLRHHLTLAERLQPNTADPSYQQRAEIELSLLERQIEIIQGAAERMGKVFVELDPETNRAIAETQAIAQQATPQP